MTLTKYFEEQAKGTPVPKFDYGDRVSAKFEGTPVVGMVIRENEGFVLVHSDLPIRVYGEIRHILSVPLKSVKRRKEL